MGEEEGGDAEHFWTNFPRIPSSTVQKGERGGVAFTGSRRRASSGLVQPFCSFGGFARVYVHSFLTVLALHSAAPFELALALVDLLDSRGVVATPTAHDLTAVRAPGRLIADPSGRAQGTCMKEYKRL